MKSSLLSGAARTIPLAMASRTQAATIILDFEGVNSTCPSGFAFVGDYYNDGVSSDGTSGTDFGIEFSENAQAICLNTPGTTCSNTSRGGQGNLNSQLGGLFYLSGDETFMNVAAGFTTGFSFLHSAIFEPDRSASMTG